MKIELDAPRVGEIEKKYLNQVIDHGFVSTFGPFIPEFEAKMAQFLGVKAAVAVQSGTAAIYMALYESGIGPGDEVIVTSVTFTATVNPILNVGAIPVIVDVDLNTWNIDPEQIRRAITSKTKAIVPVHLYGNPCAMKEILAIAREHQLKVIEDATESLGATIDGKHTGTFGDFGCFSFNGNKLITTGGGGMVVSNNMEKIERIRYLANQSKDKDRPFYHSEMGFNFRMTNLEAALGLAQFEQINDFLNKKTEFYQIYQQAFADLPAVHFQHPISGALHSWWLCCVRIDSCADVSELMQTLKTKGIPTRRIFMPVNQMPYLQKFGKSCPQAQTIYNQGVCLPSSTLNDTKDIKAAAQTIKEVLGG